MTSEHTVKSYESELKHLNQQIHALGMLVESQLRCAIDAVKNRDSDLARAVIERDPEVDLREHHVDQFAIRLLALRQPMADDLRHVVAALKISSHLERIADYAANIAKRSISLNQVAIVHPIHSIPRMAHLTQVMIHDVVEAYLQLDDEKTTRIWKKDAEVDEMYGSLLRELLTYMMEDPRNISACTHVLFMAKNIERIGDHVTNIAEEVHFITHGRPFTEPRPKIDVDFSALAERERD